ncbi:MAG: DUF4136 domain-containing protein [Hydrogenophaga sp.]|jgi:hypothetical protein|nr:DUF4136 domain-containing protein [Hydrogenophaga sp.]
MYPIHFAAPRPSASVATGWRCALAALALVMLSGCASVYLVDNQVQSYARWTDPATAPQEASAIPQPPQVYRFERLPSQGDARAAAAQDQLEALARPALERVGWTLADVGVATPWRVEVSASTLRLPRAPWEDPWYGPWGGALGGPFGGSFGAFGLPGRDYVVTGTGQVIWSPMFMRMDIPYFQRQVSVLIRHAGTGRVVYETRAAHDGRWQGSPPLWGAMLDAALQGFPVPPAGVRQVNIELPR